MEQNLANIIPHAQINAQKFDAFLNFNITSVFRHHAYACKGLAFCVCPPALIKLIINSMYSYSHTYILIQLNHYKLYIHDYTYVHKAKKSTLRMSNVLSISTAYNMVSI